VGKRVERYDIKGQKLTGERVERYDIKGQTLTGKRVERYDIKGKKLTGKSESNSRYSMLEAVWTSFRQG
jgi:hypothetical protein